MIVAELGLFVGIGVVIALVLALTAPVWTRLLRGIGKTVNHQIHTAGGTLDQAEISGDEKNDSQGKQ